MAPDNRHLQKTQVAQKSHLGGSIREELGWITCAAWKSNGEKKKNAQRTEDKSSITRTSSDLAGLLIPIGKIVQREECGQSKDFEEGN